MAVWAFDLVVLFEGVIARGEWEGFPAGLVRSFVSVSVSGYRVMVRELIPRRKAVFASDTSRKGVKEYYRGGEAGRCTSAGFTAQPPTYRIAMVKGKKSPSFGGSGMLQLERNELKRAAAKKPWRRDIETVPRSQRRLLYHLGPNALSSVAPANSESLRGSLMGLTESTGACWMVLSREAVVKVLPPLKIKAPAQQREGERKK
ncbi:hypothetical protein K438DRAFT_1947698 [Mycena galopus ATCC 62051]|nr:hypothetical protein K438DRAFT_1947698 [Mycena galopus ATCC 62051]